MSISSERGDDDQMERRQVDDSGQCDLDYPEHGAQCGYEAVEDCAPSVRDLAH
ncbi:hypothetical protein ABZ801_01200 [Actinomadura sp. NPDC047616]|uniref:hypothetical protein n=1 Tax=Actinomadura sp. NPDC047616 TaxID=3155914 RepID=UPI0033D9E05C